MVLDRQNAIAEIKRSIDCRNFLKPSKGGQYCCPFCGSGTHKNGTGAMHYYNPTNTFTCFACNKSGDILDLYQHLNNIDFNGAVEQAAAELNIIIDRHQEPKTMPQSHNADIINDKPIITAQEPIKRNTEPLKRDFTAYYEECAARIENADAVSYLTARGISIDTAKRMCLGYDPQADPANSNHPTARVIIPVTKGHYIGRRTDGIKEFAKLNNKGAEIGIFNTAALYANNETVFITEGAFDALSVIECGAAAIALNSTSNADVLIKMIEQSPTEATLIICLDNDNAGNKGAETLKKGFNRLNVNYVLADISSPYNDPNEALTSNRDNFIKAIATAQAQTALKPHNVSSYIDLLMNNEIDQLATATDRKTGFADLDEKSGGLYPGLYVIAATSSLGKTTFSHQIADNLATAGNDVLFFSMEQSRLELVTKSLARNIFLKDNKTDITSLSIRKGRKDPIINAAAAEYKQQVADRLSIIEGNFNCNISFIGDYIRQYINKTNSKPIVFIDYLQILQPAEDNKRASIKETVDNTVTELKRLSRENDLTIFVISSVNRSNYLTPIDFESLKESGGIEYTADVIWGLQLAVMNDDIFSKGEKIKEKRDKVREAKAANPRNIELVCLKNRYGISSYKTQFKYYPAHDFYVNVNANDFTPCYGEEPFKKEITKRL